MKSYRDESKEAKSHQLDDDTGHGEILAPIQLVDGVRICHLGSRDDHSPNKLEEEGEYVEANKNWRDPTS